MFRIAPRLKKITVTVVAATMATLGLAAVHPGAASAAGFTVRITTWANQFLFLDVPGSSTRPGTGIIQYSYTGGLNQVWRIRPAGSYYEIANRWSGQCLTTDGYAGHHLYQWTCNGSEGQKWDTNLSADGKVHTIGNPASGLNADIQGASGWQGAALIAWYPSGNDNQFFAALIA